MVGIQKGEAVTGDVARASHPTKEIFDKKDNLYQAIGNAEIQV